MKFKTITLLCCMLFSMVASAVDVLNYSTLPDRLNPQPLANSTLSGDSYIFLSATSDIAQVIFYIDGVLEKVEGFAPYDLAGGSNTAADPFDLSLLPAGQHTISADVVLTSGVTETTTATFTVDNPGGVMTSAELMLSNDPSRVDEAALAGKTVADDIYVFVSPVTNINRVTFYLNDPGKVNPPIQVENLAPFDFAGGSLALAAPFDTTALPEGSNTITATLLLSGGSEAEIAANFVVDNLVDPPTACPEISTLPCNVIRKNGDLTLEFDAESGGIQDVNGFGSGFTMVDPPSNPGNPTPVVEAPGLRADLITIDETLGRLTLSSTPGLRFGSLNSQDNALGVGLNVPSQEVFVTTKLVDIPTTPPGGWTQAGLWFGGADNAGLGTSEDDFVKFVVASPSADSYVLQGAVEINGQRLDSEIMGIPFGTTEMELAMAINPAERSVELRYIINGNFTVFKKFENLPDEIFSFDQAGIDPTLNTKSFAGIFASSRNSPQSIDYHFDKFTLAEETPPIIPPEFDFTRWSFPVSNPTAMAFGPDGRLYVTELLGTVHAFTLDFENQQIISDQVINTITQDQGGSRLTLGIAIDPASTPSDVVLWVNHSDGALNSGAVNSGVVSRLSGTDFATIENRITGLPRAYANHAVNSIHFGPDGKLYLAVGGNTGAGSPSDEFGEFGDRPEQPLTAAIVVADVNNPAFQGQCASPIGSFIIPSTCDASVYASGLRNPYDFVWHSNGRLYSTDNGLGTSGTYPPTTNIPCTAIANSGLHNPGVQPDLLYDILPGKYYGHPNPYRDECVFKDGTAQGVAPLANYEAPLLNLGTNKSPNGIIEYKGNAFFSRLLGQLLIANFSIGDDLARVKLSDDGESVLSFQPLTMGFTDPLPLEQDNAGHIFVGELSASQITVLIPKPLEEEPIGEWTQLADMPSDILDATGAALNDLFYVIGGKDAGGHVSTVQVFDSVQSTWTTIAPLPGVAVENSATAVYNGKLYVFGGSTAPFSGATANAAVYDPALDQWTVLASMSVARSGARAEVLQDKIYVVGGLADSGASLASVEIYDPALDSWSNGIAMQEQRDNLGTAVINNTLYAFGGRIRQANGTTIEPALSSVEAFDPVTSTWSSVAPMPTGRRAMIATVISGRIQVIGGESPATVVNEEYNPVTDTWRPLLDMPQPRHGAAHAVIRGRVYTAGGGIVAGTSYTSDVYKFQY